MAINIIIFGRLTEIAGNSLALENVRDTDALVKALHNLYPTLSDVKYMMAVNKEMVNENTALAENSTVALLPPFSGG